MSTLTWTRGKATATYHMGGTPQVVTHTTHTTVLANGDQFTITSVDGSYFFDINGVRATNYPYPSLRDAKATVQRVADQVAAKIAQAKA